jgi:hypothetical protein
VIHEHGEPLWNDIDRGKLLIRLLDLAGSSTNRDISYQAGGMVEGNDEFGLATFFVLANYVYMP